MNIVATLQKSKWLQWLFLSVGAILLFFVSNQMLDLPLWGHRPLLWLISLWLVITGVIWRRIVKSEGSLIRFLLSTCSGLLLAVSFPVSPLTPIVFVAWIPLLIFHNRSRDITTWQYFFYLYNAFFIWNMLTTYWVLNTSFFPGIVANVLNTFLMTIPWLLFKFVDNRIKGGWTLLALVAFWVSFEYIHMAWEISWPWLSLGNYFAQYPEWVQWYSITGFYGGAVWIWGVNIFIYKNWKTGIVSWHQWAKLAGLVLLPIGISLAMYYSYEDKGALAEVVIVQPNYEPHYQKFDIPEATQMRNIYFRKQLSAEYCSIKLQSIQVFAISVCLRLNFLSSI
jgi:apolipoprotein N-acyltransferase